MEEVDGSNPSRSTKLFKHLRASTRQTPRPWSPKAKTSVTVRFLSSPQEQIAGGYVKPSCGRKKYLKAIWRSRRTAATPSRHIRRLGTWYSFLQSLDSGKRRWKLRRVVGRDYEGKPRSVPGERIPSSLKAGPNCVNRSASRRFSQFSRAGPLCGRRAHGRQLEQILAATHRRSVERGPVGGDRHVSSTRRHLPGADASHVRQVKFHIAKHLSEAVDQ